MTDWYDRADHLHLPTYNRTPVHFERGEGPYLFDGDGNRYLDALAGIAVNILGYRHPRLIDAAEQAVNGVHHVSNVFYIESQWKLSEKLADQGFPGISFFCNSGAEAVEAAIKFARKYQSRKQTDARTIVSMKGSFHGRTMGALAATGQAKYRKGFEPLPEGFDRAKFNDIESLEGSVTDDTAAVIVEPIQGEGGIRPASEQFLTRVRELCDINDALMIVDEVQAGMGRTGEFFAFQHFDIEPDIICLAKGIAGGFPMGSILVHESLREKGFQSSDHASTFGGNPFVCEMGVEVIDILEQEQLVDNARVQGDNLQDQLHELSEEIPFLNQPRGEGLMMAIPVDDEIDASKLMSDALDEGLIIGTAGDNCLRLVPPLILTEENVGLICQKLHSACKQM